MIELIGIEPVRCERRWPRDFGMTSREPEYFGKVRQARGLIFEAGSIA
jgi:hypothetical protein